MHQKQLLWTQLLRERGQRRENWNESEMTPGWNIVNSSLKEKQNSTTKLSKTSRLVESKVLGTPKFWHAPHSSGGLAATLYILRNGLDITDEGGNLGPGFKWHEGDAAFLLCVPLPRKFPGLFFLFDFLRGFLQDRAEEPGDFMHLWFIFSNKLPEPENGQSMQSFGYK